MTGARSPRAVRTIEPFDLSASPAARTDFAPLERTGAKIARGLSAAFACAGQAVPIACGSVRTTTFRDWKAALPSQVAIARYRDPVIKSGLLMSVPPALIAGLVDIYYGGDGAPGPGRAAFGAAERSLFDRIAEAAGNAIAAGWADIAPLAPALTGCDFVPDDVALGKSGDLVAVQRFSLGPNYPDGGLELVYPLASLRCFADSPPGGAASGELAKNDADPVWQQRLADAVMQARLPVRTVIARPTVPLARLMSLAAGDFIPVTLPTRVPLTVAGRLLAHGTIGEANGRAAIMIDRIEHGAFDD